MIPPTVIIIYFVFSEETEKTGSADFGD